MVDIKFVDEKAFAEAIEDNEPYNRGWFEKNSNTLHTFISYYESCKNSGWQPIETAPRDGTDIFVAESDGCFHVAMYDRHFNRWRGSTGNGCESWIHDAKYWMPINLPQLPKGD